MCESYILIYMDTLGFLFIIGLVPCILFLNFRYCKQHSDGVTDVSCNLLKTILMRDISCYLLAFDGRLLSYDLILLKFSNKSFL